MFGNPLISRCLLSLFIALGTTSALAKSPPTESCKIKKLPGIQSQEIQGWEVSIEKESQRKKLGDALLAIHKVSRQRCEIALPSWGEALYQASSDRLLLIVQQGDTGYTTFSWMDPKTCKKVDETSEAGAAKISSKKISYSGGNDGPDKIPGQKIPLDSHCLPIRK